MSHLPEMEVLRKDLDKEVVGKRIKDATVRTASLVRRHKNRPDFVNAVVGRKISAVRRRGIWMLIDLDDATSLCVRLGPEGSLTRETASAEAGSQTQVVLTFTTGGALHLVDPDKAAELFVLPTADIETNEELAPGGIDPLAGTFTWHAFGQQLTSRKQPLKGLLLDESFILGLGDLYADEILWSAGLAGARASDTLSSQEVRRLYRALFEVLYEAVKQGGTSEASSSGDHTDLFGEPGEYGTHLNVHGRAGEPCPRCRRPVTLAELPGGLHLYHCAACQT